MSFLLVAQRALTVPGWVKNALWRAAKTTPSLDLPFADSKSLVDAITGRQLISFARASSGTYVDSAGVLSTATTNLLLRSEEFNDASWSKVNVTTTANTTTAPNGTITADSVTPNTATTLFYTQQNFTTTASTIYTWSVYVKASGFSWVFLDAFDGSNHRTWFDLTNGVIGTVEAGNTSTITSVGNGWYRCTLTRSSAGGSTSYAVAIVSGNNSLHGTGNSSNGIYLWGAQLEQSATVGEYIPTTSTINSAPRFDHRITSTTTNLAIRSEEFDNATWVQTGLNAFGSGSVANAIAAPDGTVTGDLIEEDTSTGFHRVSQTLISGTVSTGIRYLANGRSCWQT